MRLTLNFAILLLLAAGCSSSIGNLPLNGSVDKVILKKSERQLILMSGNKILRSYKVALGKNPIGPKTQEGDNKTPEGLYTIDKHNPNSSFHRSLHISYPSDIDRARSQQNGLRPGGDIMIHGIRNGFGWIGRLHRLLDWTQGCIAVTDAEIDEIYNLVADGTPIDLKP